MAEGGGLNCVGSVFPPHGDLEFEYRDYKSFCQERDLCCVIFFAHVLKKVLQTKIDANERSHYKGKISGNLLGPG